MRIAVIGTGISGLTAAWLLHRRHELVVYEADDRVGGHTHTVDACSGGRSWAVDTGFVVFNDRTYPNLLKIFGRLGVASQPSTMAFSVHCERTGLEYRPSSLGTLFTQRRNLFRWPFWRMLWDIRRFSRQSLELLGEEPRETLGQYLRRRRYSRGFIEHFIVPMGAAIWSAEPVGFEAFPAALFARFFANHGFLRVRGQPQWRVVAGGSREYLKPLTGGFAGRIRTSCPVRELRRRGGAVDVTDAAGRTERFDEVVLAVHSDQALAMLADPTADEREVLGAIAYQDNHVDLHTDTTLLPNRRAAWASWNYRIPAEPLGRVAVTYNMNMLQSLDAPETFCVTLNQADRIAPGRKLFSTTYAHPVYTPSAAAAQKRHGEISGVRRTHYCGAYWGYGFHEDGVNSALAVGRHFGLGIDDA